jgi:hypothetical protein
MLQSFLCTLATETETPMHTPQLPEGQFGVPRIHVYLVGVAEVAPGVDCLVGGLIVPRRSYNIEPAEMGPEVWLAGLHGWKLHV